MREIGFGNDERLIHSIIQSAPVETKDTIDDAINEGAKQEDYDSSDLELSSSSSEEEEEKDEEEEEEKRSVGGSGDDGEDEDNTMTILRTANEITKVVVQRPEFNIRPNMTLSCVGHIHEVIDKVIVIQSGANVPALDMGTLFTYSDRSIMGEVFETFGPVSKPFYSVLFNSAEEIDASKAVVGSEVFFVPDYERTKVVPTEELRKMKYTDASNMYDEEISGSDAEFSDDEAEMKYKRFKKKQKGRAKEYDSASNEQKYLTKDKPYNAPYKRHRFYDEPDDFDSALAAYEQSNVINSPGVPAIPQRQVQSYADIFEGPAVPAPPMDPRPYKSPEELVRAHHRKSHAMPQNIPPRSSAGYSNAPSLPSTATATATVAAAATSTTTTTTTTKTIITTTPAPAASPASAPVAAPAAAPAAATLNPIATPSPVTQSQVKQTQKQPVQSQSQQQQKQQSIEQPQEGSARAVLLAMLQSNQTPK
ncbi:Gar1/Naf1 RNA binding region-domain-containing protein [Dichotomocladium elegans]|nr:Gar1/Naf1 RNA binding region-domain-containing protein [Dichotomocladium elegans]